MRNINLKVGVFLLSFIFIVGTGCKKKDEPAPEIPPITTFQMDLDDFDTTQTAKAIFVKNSTDTVSFTNWRHAAVNVLCWNFVITVYAIVPIAAFKESFNHEAEYDPDNEEWTWEYTVICEMNTYTAKLKAKMNGNYVHWEMYISKQNGYSNFKWYEGDSHINLTDGTWTLYKSPYDPEPFIGIEWHRNTSDGTYDIKYTNIEPNGPENGGYIQYGIINDPSYDAFYNIYNKGEDNKIEIKWNRTTKEGRVKDQIYFGDQQWHCWNAQLHDIDCVN